MLQGKIGALHGETATVKEYGATYIPPYCCCLVTQYKKEEQELVLLSSTQLQKLQWMCVFCIETELAAFTAILFYLKGN